jgi:hypothetical protein
MLLGDTASGEVAAGDLSCSIEHLDSNQSISSSSTTVDLTGYGSCSWPGTDAASADARFSLSGSLDVNGCHDSPYIVITGPFQVTLSDERSYSLDAHISIDPTPAGENTGTGHLTTDSGQIGTLEVNYSSGDVTPLALTTRCGSFDFTMSASGSLTSPSAPSAGPSGPIANADPEQPPPSALTAPGSAGELTAQQLAQAREIMKDDTYFREVTDGVPYSVALAGPWTTMGTPGNVAPRLLGVSFLVKFDRAATVNAVDLPTIIYDEAEQANPPYQEVVDNFTVGRLRDLYLLVDLNSRKLVNLTPGPDSDDVAADAPAGFTRLFPVGDGSR